MRLERLFSGRQVLSTDWQHERFPGSPEARAAARLMGRRAPGHPARVNLVPPPASSWATWHRLSGRRWRLGPMSPFFFGGLRDLVLGMRRH